MLLLSHDTLGLLTITTITLTMTLLSHDRRYTRPIPRLRRETSDILSERRLPDTSL